MHLTWGIRRRITVAVLGVVAAALVVLVVGVLWIGGRRVEALAAGERAELAAEKAEAVRDWIDGRLQLLSVVAAWPGLTDRVSALDRWPPDPAMLAATETELRRWVGRVGALFDVIVVVDAATGRVVAASRVHERGKIYRNRSYVTRAIATGAPVVQSPYFALPFESVTLAVAIPIANRAGRIVGVVVGQTRLAGLNAIIGRQAGALASSASYVVNRAQLFVTEPPGVTDPAALRRPTFAPFVEACIAGRSATATEVDHRGRPVIAAYVWLADHELCVVSQIDRADVAAVAAELAGLIVAIGAAVALLAAGVSALLARALADPIIALAAAARRIGDGARDVRLPDAHRADELGTLARAFNAMAADVAVREAKLERSNQDLREFAHLASHDLQEPLRKIVAFGTLLAREKAGALDAEGHGYLATMRDAATRMQRLISSLLDYAKISAATTPFTPTDLDAVVRRVLDDLSIVIAETRAVITVAPLPTVPADPTQLARVFQNLIGNALKFRRPEEPPRIAIAVAPANGDDNDDAMVRITVRDHGIGFDPRYAGDIFAPFRRLHGRATYPGSGMGLAICRKVVERHGGTIVADSTSGGGTTITVTLPTAAPATLATAAD